MGNVASTILRNCGDSVEPAEEVAMDTGTVAVETEQPQSAPSPIPDGAGVSSVGSEVKVTQPEGGVKDSVAASGSDKPLIDLSSSKESLDSKGQGEMADVKTESAVPLGASNTEKSVPSQNDDVSIATNGVDTKSEASVSVKAEGEGVDKVDKLSQIAQQIDDFDPSPIFNKASVPVSVVGDSSGVDINDSDLVDNLIKESEAGVTDSKDVAGSDNMTGEVTQGEAGVDGECLSDDNDTEVVNSVEVTDDNQQNGDMSASTESEGFTEEKVEEEAESKKNVTKENKAATNKENQKQETASPTKSAKSKKKEDKSIEHILKALSSLQTTEEKLAALCKKYADLHEEHRVIQSSLKQTQRKLAVTSREKDQLQSEHTKAVMAKSKLESLCRELQKHNQTIRQESLQRAKEEDEKRKEISQKFQTTIGEIQTQMQDNHERNKQLREENFELANKLKKFIEQYEAREKQVEMVIQHRELEQKLADAKLEQASAVLAEVKSKNQKEKELLLLQTTEVLKKVQLKDTELNMYKERYEEFQSTIKKSEEIYSKFKVEMEKMTKRCKKLEKDSNQWRGKWENANRALLEMAEEKQKYDKERPLLMTKINKLESLCRAMQAERQARKLLENENISGLSELDKLAASADTNGDSPPDSTTPDPAAPSPSPTDSSEDKKDDKESGDSDGCASEQTGVTVIQQEATATNDTSADTSQSEDQKQDSPDQSDGPTQDVTSGTDQSEASSQQEIPQDKEDAAS